MTHPAELSTDVLIIGGGPAGLTAAASLAPRVDGHVLVVDREAAAGGIPRHSDHPGYGIRDLKRFLSGPAYARRLVATATRRRRRDPDANDGHRLGRRAHRRGHQPPWSPTHPRQDDRPRHRRPRTTASRAPHPRRPPRRRLHHRPAPEPRAPAPPHSRHSRRHRRRRTRQLVRGDDTPGSSLPARPDDQRIPRPRGLRRVHHPRPSRTENPRRYPYPAHSHHRPRPGKRRRNREPRHRTRAARSTATPSSSPATGSPTTNWPAPPTSRSTPTRGALSSTQDKRPATRGVFAIGNLTHPVDTADVAALDGRAVAQHVLAYLSGQRLDPAGPRPRILPGKHLKWITPGVLNAAAEPPRRRLRCLATNLHQLPNHHRYPGQPHDRTPSPAMAGVPWARVPHPGIGDRECTTGARRSNYRPRLAQSATRSSPAPLRGDGCGSVPAQAELRAASQAKRPAFAGRCRATR